MTVEQILQLDPNDYCLGELQEVLEELVETHYVAVLDRNLPPQTEENKEQRSKWQTHNRRTREQLAHKYTQITTYYNKTAGFKCYYTAINRWHVEEVKPDRPKIERPTTNLRKPRDLSSDEITEIARLMTTDAKRVDIAAHYHIHPSTLGDIRSGRLKPTPAPTDVIKLDSI